jgi:hypothetical protein
MIIIWKGAGGLVILFGIVVCLALNVITSASFHQNDYFQTHLWTWVAALWITGALCRIVGTYLRGKPGRVVIDKATGKEIVVKREHHLMFIKVEYWAFIFLAIGAAVLVANLV